MGDGDLDDGDEDEAVSLVRLAGRRPTPKAEEVAAARAQVLAAWRSGVERRRRLNTLLATAASLAGLVVAVLASRELSRREPARARVPEAPVAATAARLDAASGTIEWESPSGWAPLAVGDPLPVGSRVRTAAAGAGLRVDDGRSVRIAGHSLFRWEALDRLRLEAGALYVDSGGSGDAGGSFVVATSWGHVRETGTQFEVRLDADALRVRVREGRVSVHRGGVAVVPPGREREGETASRGTELRLDERGVTRRAIPVHGDEWAWVMKLGPGYEMEGRSLADLAAWAAREAGYELRYADTESRRRARGAVLHGSIRGMRADEAVAAVLPSTGLPYHLEAGVLWIGPGRPRSAAH